MNKNEHKPETVQCPTVTGTNCRTVIPELGGQQLPAWIDEAAAVGGGGGIVAGEWTVGGAAGTVDVGDCGGGRRH